MLFSLFSSELVFSQSKYEFTFKVDLSKLIDKKIFNRDNGDVVVFLANFNNWESDTLAFEKIENRSIYTKTYLREEIDTDTILYKYKIIRSDGYQFLEYDSEKYFVNGNRIFIINDNLSSPRMISFSIQEKEFYNKIKISPDELRYDLTMLRDSLEHIHPSLYEFTDKSKFDSLFAYVNDQLDHPMSNLEFYKLVRKIISKIGCLHTSIFVPKYYWTNNPDRILPLQLYFGKSETFIVNCFNENHTIPPGSIVVSINGVSMNIIRTKLMENYPADGFNEGYRRFMLNMLFPDFYAIYYGFPDEFKIEYRSRVTNLFDKVVLKPVSIYDLTYFGSLGPDFSFEALEIHNVGVLKINNFMFYQEKKRKVFYSFIDSVFKKIHEDGIENLILDIRGNSGGDPLSAAYLFTHLINHPVKYFAETYDEEYVPLAKSMPVSENRFGGNIFVLINSRCVSTAGHLAALLKYHKIGTLIGTETGSNYKCFSGQRRLTLTNSQLRINISTTTFEVEVNGMKNNHGVQPDYYIESTIDDVLNGNDNIMQSTIDMIRNLTFPGN
jgi:hypothetical protein